MGFYVEKSTFEKRSVHLLAGEAEEEAWEAGLELLIGH